MQSWCRSILAVLTTAVSTLAMAQIIAFEGVCPSPSASCSVGTAYAPAGVTFTPTPSIWGGIANGDPGNWGLNGTNGPSFLGINSGSGYQVQLDLARNATYFAVDVARSNGSVDGSFTLTLFNSGVQVFTDTVTLGAINSWQRVAGSVAGGFNRAVLSGAGTGSHPFGIDNIQIGGNCFGFSDVAPTDSYCNAAEWLGNRLVTTGCAAGQYCPGNFVSRAQMALFMNRLGNALTPTIVSVSDVTPAPVDPDSQPRLCVTGDLGPVNYDRRAVVSGTFAGDAAGALEYRHILRFSADGGLTWGYVTTNFNRSGTTAAHWISSTVSDSVVISAGRSYRFAIEIGRQSGAADFTDYRCFLTAQAFSVSGTTAAPFDAAPGARRDSDGR